MFGWFRRRTRRAKESLTNQVVTPRNQIRCVESRCLGVKIPFGYGSIFIGTNETLKSLLTELEAEIEQDVKPTHKPPEYLQ
jgi:hypothetical protein